MAPAGEWPKAAFTHDSSLSAFNTPPRTYLANHPDSWYAYIATGSVVLDTSMPESPRVLLLQRSKGDSMPGRWEIPGGGCDDEDESILHSAARELWEEAGLEAKHIKSQVGQGELFTSSSGKRVCKLTFIVEAKQAADGTLEVKLDPEEHQKYAWATKQEVEAHMVGDLKLEFTSSNQERAVLSSFLLDLELH